MPGAGEPLWLDEDREWALALLAVEADTCTGCGQPLSETLSPEAEGRYRAEVIKCHACATGAIHVEHWQKQGGDARGAHVRVHRREEAPWQTAR